jgi:FHS family L-fucose permease-like MFS transporter
MRLKTMPIFLAFFLMGFADAMSPLRDAVQAEHGLSNFISALLPFVVFIAFAIFSIPGGLLAARIGKKKLLLLGLGLNIIALLIPSIQSPSFPLLLSCIFVLGIGTTLLQVAGNPIMRDVSAEGAYSRNLSFAQGIKGIGSTASTYLVSVVTGFVFFQSMGWRGAFPLFCALMILAFVSVAALKVDEAKPAKPPGLGSSLGLLGHPVFLMAVIGIFLYVGAEQCMSSYLKDALRMLGMNENNSGRLGPALFLAMLTVGRILGGVILHFISPRTCFRISALLGLLGAGTMMFISSTYIAVAMVVIAGLGFANIWPMLFSITIEDKPECSNELSGLMCMAISGGALLPLLMGWLRDLGWGALSYIVPALCFAYLLLISIKGGGKPADASYARDTVKAA